MKSIRKMNEDWCAFTLKSSSQFCLGCLAIVLSIQEVAFFLAPVAPEAFQIQLFCLFTGPHDFLEILADAVR